MADAVRGRERERGRAQLKECVAARRPKSEDKAEPQGLRFRGV